MKSRRSRTPIAATSTAVETAVAVEHVASSWPVGGRDGPREIHRPWHDVGQSPVVGAESRGGDRKEVGRRRFAERRGRPLSSRRCRNRGSRARNQPPTSHRLRSPIFACRPICWGRQARQQAARRAPEASRAHAGRRKEAARFERPAAARHAVAGDLQTEEEPSRQARGRGRRGKEGESEEEEIAHAGWPRTAATCASPHA